MCFAAIPSWEPAGPDRAVCQRRTQAARREGVAVVALEGLVVAHPGLPTFEEAFPRLFHDAYRVGFRLLGDRGEAEDVAQEACARTFSRWSSVRDYAEPWCVRVASNLALDALRSRARGQRRQHQLEDSALVTATAVAVDDRLDLYAALSLLP